MFVQLSLDDGGTYGGTCDKIAVQNRASQTPRSREPKEHKKDVL